MYLSKSQTDKIDITAINGLSGATDSLGYKVHEIEKHFHNSEQLFGNNGGFMAADGLGVFTVTGGNNAWGTELHIHAGDVIESGSSTKKFDLNRIYITAVDEANKISIVEFLYAPIGTTLTGFTIDETGGTVEDMFSKNSHGLSNGDKIVFTNVVTTTGINAYTVYYIVGAQPNYFQVSLTLGGAAVSVTGDGSCSLVKLSQTSLTKLYVAMAAVTNDAIPLTILSPRVNCNQRVFVRAKSETGSHVDIKFLLGLHTYTA